jgi:hypothetical protein
MTFRFQANEEQCYLVQDEEARRWREPRPQHKEDEVAPTKPKDKSFNGRHQPKKSKPINKAKEEKKMEIMNTPANASPTSSPSKKTRKMWRVKRVSSESSTLGLDEPKD